MTMHITISSEDTRALIEHYCKRMHVNKATLITLAMHEFKKSAIAKSVDDEQ